ncbi:hypothetical protein FRC12_016064 [Ceratobasidium sp. 428]|nr:hypothetical protein FRC12_016064 [Ceratobasidium sp. 428]
MKRKAPPPPVRAAPAAKLVKALYSYQASGADELSLQEGTTYELTPDGENFGDGWWEGMDSKGKKVSVSTNDFSPGMILKSWCIGYLPK